MTSLLTPPLAKARRVVVCRSDACPGDSRQVARPRNVPLRRSFIFAAIGQGVYALSQWGTLAGLAKLGTPETVGYFALTISLTAPVVELTGLQLHVAQATDAKGEYRLGEYLRLRTLSGVLAVAVVFGIMLVGARPTWFMAATLAMCLAKVIEGLSLICHGRFQREERLDWVARSQVLRGLLSFAGVCGVFYMTRSLVLASVCCAILWGFVYFVHDLPVAQASEARFRTGKSAARSPGLLSLARTSAPLGLAVGLNTLSANIPRYFVDAYFGPRELGIFAALSYVGIAARLFYLPLIHTILPRLALLAKEARWQAFRHLLAKALLFAVGSSLGLLVLLAFAGRFFLSVIYTPAYAEHSGLLLILAGGVLLHFVAAVAIAALQGCRRFTQVMSTYACGNLVLVIALPVAISVGGLNGAAVATIFGALGELLTALFWISRLPRKNTAIAFTEGQICPSGSALRQGSGEGISSAASTGY
ncbi:MAG: lipopolysaccharide biosynthesis protein [Thermoguttaceae bacterium]|nr:lipopolysaccharide biosynthesis protein [Thermoguttaceae bacterium]MDW8079041.1 lipopolysaccharide biosynthesis protein [Thermoguttaceae bacterium]